MGNERFTFVCSLVVVKTSNQGSFTSFLCRVVVVTQCNTIVDTTLVSTLCFEPQGEH